MKKQDFYRRHLPHLQLPNQTYFVTWLLNGALPRYTIRRIVKQNLGERNQLDKVFLESTELNRLIQSNYFNEFDQKLNHVVKGSHYLRKSVIAEIVSNSLHYWDNKRIDLICYCIMSNHVHVLFSLYETNEDGEKNYMIDIVESIKKFSARECNKILGKKGPFWQHESYDRLIRDREELYRTIIYILENPVQAGYCKSRSEYKWSYIKPEYQDLAID